MRRPVVTVLALCALLVAGCSGDDAAPVLTEQVQRADVAEVVDAPGTVTARASSTLTAPADGTVAALLVADGATVAAGTEIALLESPAAQERLTQARAAQAQASTDVELPRADLGPLQDQLDAAAAAALAAGRAAAALIPDPVAQAQALGPVEQAAALYEAAAAAARSAAGSADTGVASLEEALQALTGSSRAQADALVRAAEDVVEGLTLVAPIAGVVTFGAPGAAPAGGGGGADLLDQLPPELQGTAQSFLGGSGAPATTSSGLSVGTPVASGSPLLTITDTTGLEVTAEVDETDVLLVRQGTPAGVELDALPGQGFEASVRAVDVTPSAGSGGGVVYRVRLSLVLPPDGPQPLPGMSAVVDLRVRDATGVVSVPSAAVLRDAPQEAVFVVEDGVYRRRDVVVGVEGEDRVEVTGGLELGEVVVVRDADRLVDGQPVA